jgi:hypothetical protein
LCIFASSGLLFLLFILLCYAFSALFPSCWQHPCHCPAARCFSLGLSISGSRADTLALHPAAPTAFAISAPCEAAYVAA